MSNGEREMTTHQRSLVDNCFEEGQYESGMAVLDQLRSSSVTPPPGHIRQLIYIALFPPPTGDQINKQEFPPTPVKGSPTKLKPSLSKASLSPSAAESETAQRVLFSFLSTNSPRSLFRALPRYPLDVETDRCLLQGPTDNSQDEDSLIAQEALCLKDCKNCWATLKEGFIQRKILLPQDQRKKRGRSAYDVGSAVLDQGSDTPAIVAEHAWPILQWLLSLFEKDELLNSQESAGKFSPLLLSQIPPPRGGAGPRWEASAPLDIVFHSLEQNDGERRDMATRLLTLLINLSLSKSFDGIMFATTLTTRLHTCSSQLVQNLMESLPKTVPVLAWKITVCQKFLSSSSSIAGGGTKPRPKPVPRHGSQRDLGITSTAVAVDVGRAAPNPLVTCCEVFRLLRSDHKSHNSISPALTIKYALLVSYAQLQGLVPPEERDNEWKVALSSGELKRLIGAAFPSGSTYHVALMTITNFWTVG